MGLPALRPQSAIACTNLPSAWPGGSRSGVSVQADDLLITRELPAMMLGTNRDCRSRDVSPAMFEWLVERRLGRLRRGCGGGIAAFRRG